MSLITLVDGIRKIVSGIGLYDPVHRKDMSYSAFGTLKIANETIIGDYRLDKQSIVDKFDIERGNNGRYEVPAGDTGLKAIVPASGDSIEFKSKEVHYYQSARGLMVKQSVILGDTGVSGCKREWGFKSDDDAQGCFLRLDGTTLSWVIKRDNVETVINASAWDTPVTTGGTTLADTFTGNGSLWYIQMEWLGVGDIFLYHQEKIVHTYSFTGTSTEFSIGNPDMKVYYYIENSSNNDERYLKAGCASVLLEGGANAARLDAEASANDVAALTKSQLIGQTPEDGHYHNVQATHKGEIKSYSRQELEQFTEMLHTLKGIKREIRHLRYDIGRYFNDEPEDII